MFFWVALNQADTLLTQTEASHTLLLLQAYSKTAKRVF